MQNSDKSAQVPALARFPFPGFSSQANFYPLRSPKDEALRPIWDADGYENLSYFDGQEIKCAYFAMSQAGKPIDPSVNYRMNHVCRDLFRDHEGVIRHLFELDYFVRPAAVDAIKDVSVADLADFAASCGLERLGTKNALLDRILSSVDADRIESFLDTHLHFTLGQYGAMMVRTLYNDMYCALCNMYQLISRGNIVDALDLLIDYRSRTPGCTAMGFSYSNKAVARRFMSTQLNAARAVYAARPAGRVRTLAVLVALHGYTPAFDRSLSVDDQ